MLLCACPAPGHVSRPACSAPSPPSSVTPDSKAFEGVFARPLSIETMCRRLLASLVSSDRVFAALNFGYAAVAKLCDVAQEARVASLRRAMKRAIRCPGMCLGLGRSVFERACHFRRAVNADSVDAEKTRLRAAAVWQVYGCAQNTMAARMVPVRAVSKAQMHAS